MSGWALLPVVAATLYCFWLLLSFTFDLIDRRHEALRESKRHRGGA